MIPDPTPARGPEFFHGLRWDEITREERVFCARLWEHIRGDVSSFVGLINVDTGLALNKKATWDVGFEVCFYRDLTFRGLSAKSKGGYSPKRTFDLALFSEEAIVVIEAKAFLPFAAGQARSFVKDRTDIRRILGRPELDVHLLAVGSSKYFERTEARPLSKGLSPFVIDGHLNRLTWKSLAIKYGDPLFARADASYGAKSSR